MTSARTVVARVGIGLAAVLAAYGAWHLRRAQILLGPIVVTLLAWPVFYFGVYARAAALLASEPGSVDPGSDERSWVGIAALVLAALAVEGIVYASMAPPVTTFGVVQAKSASRPRYEDMQWRLELDSEHYFRIPYGQGVTVQKGRRVSYTHRDAWLGVRIVDGYDLGKRP